MPIFQGSRKATPVIPTPATPAVDDTTPKTEADDEPKPSEADVLRAEVKSLAESMGTLTESVGAIGRAVEANSNRPAAQPAAPTPKAPVVPQFNPAELDAAIAAKIEDPDADGPSVGQMIQTAIKTAGDEIIQGQINPLRASGGEALSNLNMQMAVQSGAIPFYGKNEKVTEAFDTMMGSIDPSLRSDPKVIENIYNAAVGSNIGDIVAAEVQTQLHKDDEPTPTPAPGSRASVGSAGKQVPTAPGDTPLSAEEMGGEAGLIALERTGKTPDSLARSMGYDGWDEYAKMYKETMSEEEVGNA